MSISPIGNSLQSSQPAAQPATQTLAQQTSQSTSGQNVAKGGHHHGGKGGKAGKGGGAQNASATSGTSGTLVFDPATGAMVPIGTVSTTKATTKAPGTIDIIT